jgi:hypothetical protein
MKKKNNYTETSVSFEDFEQAMLSPNAHTSPVDELVKERLGSEKESRKKEAELKKAYQKAKRQKKTN